MDAKPLPDLRTRVTLSPEEAAAALGVSRGTFDNHIAPELRTIYVGRRRLVSVKELERWADKAAIRI